MADTVFVDGMKFEKPGENAPDFVKGKISIKVDQLIPWLEANKNEKGWINIDLKKSKENNLYLALNNYKKRVKVEEGEAADDEIPF